MVEVEQVEEGPATCRLPGELAVTDSEPISILKLSLGDLVRTGTEAREKRRPWSCSW